MELFIFIQIELCRWECERKKKNDQPKRIHLIDNEKSFQDSLLVQMCDLWTTQTLKLTKTIKNGEKVEEIFSRFGKKKNEYKRKYLILFTSTDDRPIRYRF